MTDNRMKFHKKWYNKNRPLCKGGEIDSDNSYGKLFKLTLDLKVSGKFTTYHSLV